jgi:LCP family protein required for cell wall assembly
LKTDDRTVVSDSGTAGNGYGSTPIYKKDRMDADIRNILLLGTDSYDITTDRGRSDTMLILSYNTKEGTIKLISLLRDSLVPIEGHGWNRLNTAYFFGGAGLAVNTINQLFGLDIRDYVIVDFNGVKDFINYIGGVDLPLTEEEAALYSTYTGRTIEAGPNHLDAELALMHMRNRTIGTDFGRTQRQRDTVTAIISQILKEKSVAEITEIIEYAFSLVKTNIPVSTMLSLAASVIGQASSLTFETANIPYSDSYQFAWYNKMAIISFDIGKTAEKLKTFLYD